MVDGQDDDATGIVTTSLLMNFIVQAMRLKGRKDA